VDRRIGAVQSEESDQSQLRAAIADLPEEQCAVIMLSYFAGMSSSEIADRVGVPTGTVKSRAAAAMQKLRRALRGAGGRVMTTDASF
jgi:RNA polymerase sigma-70 factor (ECF subfamily)